MIKINDKYFIDATPNCYILKEHSIVQKEESENFGNDIYTEVGYYINIETLLKGVMQKEIRQFISEDEEKDISSLLKYIKKQDKMIKSFNLNI